MQSLILQPTITAEWQYLIKEAEARYKLILSEELESYLVFLLIRFTSKPEIARAVLALDFMRSLTKRGQEKFLQMRDIGDQCLLFAGLFPDRAEKKRVKISYFVNLGQSAYSVVATLSKQKLAQLYVGLQENFVYLVDILLAIRSLQPNRDLGLLQAQELWCDTGSRLAHFRLKDYIYNHKLHSENNTRH